MAQSWREGLRMAVGEAVKNARENGYEDFLKSDPEVVAADMMDKDSDVEYICHRHQVNPRELAEVVKEFIS